MVYVAEYDVVNIAYTAPRDDMICQASNKTSNHSRASLNQ